MKQEIESLNLDQTDSRKRLRTNTDNLVTQVNLDVTSEVGNGNVHSREVVVSPDEDGKIEIDFIGNGEDDDVGKIEYLDENGLNMDDIVVPNNVESVRLDPSIGAQLNEIDVEELSDISEAEEYDTFVEWDEVIELPNTILLELARPNKVLNFRARASPTHIWKGVEWSTLLIIRKSQEIGLFFGNDQTPDVSRYWNADVRFQYTLLKADGSPVCHGKCAPNRDNFLMIYLLENCFISLLHTFN